ncbi:MAG TPA: DUF72 domain-containing protein [Candidatus Polarisedimenticolaceae bacterium]
MKRPQRGLFGDSEDPAPAKRRRSEGVGPAPVADALVAIASRLPEALRLGTSSWSFPGWKGIVYDVATTATELSRRGLEAYAKHPLLRTVGVDRTFYAPVTAEVLRGYAAQVPGDFRFVVKAPSLTTSPVLFGEGGAPQGPNELFLDAAWAEEFSVRPFVEGLAGKGGALLFQFPPLGAALTARPEQFAERLARFLQALPRGVPYAVELRDGKLFVPDYAGALKAGGATHCLSIHPRVPPIGTQRSWSDPQEGPLVIRWMLHSGMNYEQARERYAPFDRIVDDDPDGRAAVATAAVEALTRNRSLFVIANNKAEGSSPHTIFRLAARILEGLG